MIDYSLKLPQQMNEEFIENVFTNFGLRFRVTVDTNINQFFLEKLNSFGSLFSMRYCINLN